MGQHHSSGSVVSCSVLPCRAKEPESLLVSVKCKEQGAAGLLRLPTTFSPLAQREEMMRLCKLTSPCAQKQAQGQ